MNFSFDNKPLAHLLSTSRSVVITTHKSPDGDAMGSSLALFGMLKIMDHLQVTVIVPDRFPEFLSWMSGSEYVIVFESQEVDASKTTENADIIFALDYNRLDRVGKLGECILKSSAYKIMIDHHIDPSNEFDLVISSTKSSSTCEMIVDFARQMNWMNLIDSSIAECLYSGIMTDTGSFRFSSTSAHTHRVVSELFDAGLIPEKVHQRIFDQYSFERLQLVGFALSERFEYRADKGISIIKLSEADKHRFSYKKGDTEGLVNYGLSVKGAFISIFLSEEFGAVKFSFRSKGDIDVNVFARKYFNGGGHKNAAGGKLEIPLKLAYDALNRALNEYTF